jgi:6-phosphogluconolactonase
VGEDGHTASLFPNLAYSRTELVHAVHDAPKPPPDRVSLSAATLSRARAILIVTTGAGKRDAVAAWRAGHDLPVAEVGGETAVDVLLDREACGDPR